MGGSYPWVHVPWPIKFGPRATQGLAGACLHFSPLPKVIFSGALSQPFWIAESWFLLRNFWHYNLLRIWYDIGSNQKFCILRFSTFWSTFKKNFILCSSKYPKAVWGSQDSPHSQQRVEHKSLLGYANIHTKVGSKIKLKFLNQTDFLIFSAFLMKKLRTFNIPQMFPSSRPFRYHNRKSGKFEFSCQKSVVLGTDSRFH